MLEILEVVQCLGGRCVCARYLRKDHTVRTPDDDKVTRSKICHTKTIEFKILFYCLFAAVFCPVRLEL